jgi:Tol biopolymer transport system component/mono/diheme cytochrome c family protein
MRERVLTVAATAILLGSVAGFSQPGGARRAPQPEAATTFAATIAPILYANCVTCHRSGEAAPFPLISYEDVAKRGDLIAEVTQSKYMPPWHAAPGHGEFLGERRLTDAQIAAIGGWVKAGMPRGDASKMPKLPAFPSDGWRLGQPDLILEMPVGFDLPASGPDVFRNFVIPTNLTEDRWVRGIEFRPSARKVVHHALFAYVPGGQLAARDGADGRPGFGGMGAVGVGNARADSRGLGGWAVGATPMLLPAGVAARLPKGSDFLLQMHFHLSGKPETEKSLIGIYFADKAPEKDLFSVELPALFGVGAGIDIPPGEKRYTIQDSFTLPGDVSIYSATAHAHYLAKEMKATATLPDGSTKPLIWINDWDFNWQDSYVYKSPFTLPKGTRIDVTLIYDNSTDNPRNPISPPRRALWGEQSFDEMGMVGFGFEVLNKADVPTFQQTLAARAKSAIAAGGKDGTIGRFLARQQRQNRGLQQLTIFDRQGNVVSRVGEPGSFSQAAFSPDGARLAVIKRDPDSDSQDVWTFDIETGKGTSITSDSAADAAPVWSPDGRSIAYVSIRDNTHGLYRRATDGTGNEERLYQHTTGAPLVLTDWSADGRFLCFWSGDTMFILPLAGDRKPVELKREEFFGRGGRLSPDGRFLAFNSNESGRFQIIVKPFDASLIAREPSSAGPPRESTTSQVSPDGGIGGIVWRKDGQELFYLSQPPGQAVMAVEVATAPTFQARVPQRLFALPTPVGAPAQLSAVSSPDGQRFVFAVNVPSRPAR